MGLSTLNSTHSLNGSLWTGWCDHDMVCLQRVTHCPSVSILYKLKFFIGSIKNTVYTIEEQVVAVQPWCYNAWEPSQLQCPNSFLFSRHSAYNGPAYQDFKPTQQCVDMEVAKVEKCLLNISGQMTKTYCCVMRTRLNGKCVEPDNS